jgi:cold shock CspA family protein
VLDVIKMLLSRPPHSRFTGCITRIGPAFGFIRLDNLDVDVFFHKNICDEVVPFDTLTVGQRLRFNVLESKHHPGKLVAGRISREEKI